MQSVTGEWHGHYDHFGSCHRVIARFQQEDHRVFGEMIDLQGEQVTTLYDYVANAGMAPGTDEEITRQLRLAMPDAPKCEVYVRTILPELSIIEGTLSESTLRFTKTYQGECSHSFEIGDQAIRQTAKGHAVDYRGHLSEDGARITGRWHIFGPPTNATDGDFELSREK